MKKVFVVVKDNKDIVCVFSVEGTARRFCKDYGYSYESYIVE